MALNKTVIQGRLTRNVELRCTQAGTSVASFTVAWSERYKDTERQLFLPCVAWRGTAEMLSQYFRKGSELVVEGSLSSRKWTDKNGNDRETVELAVDRVHFCGPKQVADSTDYTEADFAECDDSDLPF